MMLVALYPAIFSRFSNEIEGAFTFSVGFNQWEKQMEVVVGFINAQNAASV